jgi:V8-like Glu-specific endopeptidase
MSKRRVCEGGVGSVVCVSFLRVLAVLAAAFLSGRLAGELSAQAPVVDSVLVDDTVVPGTGEADSPSDNASSFPDDPGFFRPLPLPKSLERDGDAAGLRPAGGLVSIDLRTREVTYRDPSAIGEILPGISEREGGPGALPSGLDLEHDDGARGEGDGEGANFSALSLLSQGDTEAFPNRVTVKLFQCVRDTGGTLRGYVCSGALIDSKHVITAGHCVYFHDDDDNGYVFNDWAETVTVVPAYRDGNRPYGDATATQLHSWTGWTDDENFDHDIGVIDLDRPIGAITGWFGWGWTDSCSFFQDASFTGPGYPAESPYDGERMYTWSGTFDSCENILGLWIGNEIRFERRSYGGQSGSGIWYVSGGGRFVRSVLSNGTSSYTDCVRIDEGKFDNIGTFIDDDTPGSRDLVAMDVQASPSAARAGEPLDSMSYLVHNYSSASHSGTVTVRVYLSSNDSIAASDTLLQTHTFSGTIGPKGSLRINVSTPPAVPAGTATGSYFLGVILDLSDASTANNDSSGQDAAAISVLPVGCNGRSLSNRGTISPTLTPQTATGSVTATVGGYYTVNVATPGVYTFTMCSGGGSASYDSWLCLYDASFNLITENDDTCGLDSEISRSLAAGTYRVAVSGFSSSAGSYTLAYFKEVTCNGRTLSDGGTIQLQAAPQTVSGNVTATVGRAYRFDVSETSTCTFTMCSNGGTANYDPWLCVFNEAGELVRENDDTCALLSQAVITLTPGSYRVAVSGFSSSAGNYTLAYFRRGTCNHRELAESGAITPSFSAQSVSGSTTATLGRYYTVSIGERGTYVFHTCPPDGAADYDSWLCLFDASWNVLASNDDFCELQSEVSRLLNPGTYFLGVSGYASRNGTYTVSYFGIPTCNNRALDESGEIEPLVTPQTVGGSIAPDSADVYTVEAVTAGRYLFETCGLSGFDTWICLYDRNWTILAQNDDACGLQSRVAFDLPVPGFYHVALSGFAATSGNYRMQYSMQPACNRRPSTLRGVLRPTTTPQVAVGSIAATASDLYPVEIAADGDHVFTFCRGGGSAGWDTWLCLFDAQGRPLFDVDDSCGLQSEIARFLPAGSYFLGVSGFSLAHFGPYRLAYCREASGLWIRCDHNCDGTPDLSDAVNGLNQLFVNSSIRPCCDLVTDCNSDTRHDLADWIFLLNWRFLGGPTPRAPFPSCGGEGCPSHDTCN